MAGAGLSGLAVPYELHRASHNVVAVEASTRAGGRARTGREPFSPGLFAEAGPIRFHDNHDWTLYYLTYAPRPRSVLESAETARTMAAAS